MVLRGRSWHCRGISDARADGQSSVFGVLNHFHVFRQTLCELLFLAAWLFDGKRKKVMPGNFTFALRKSENGFLVFEREEKKKLRVDMLFAGHSCFACVVNVLGVALLIERLSVKFQFWNRISVRQLKDENCFPHQGGLSGQPIILVELWRKFFYVHWLCKIFSWSNFFLWIVLAWVTWHWGRIWAFFMKALSHFSLQFHWHA